MATACLFLGWNRPSSSGEGYGIWGEVQERVAQFKKDGWCESYQLIGLTPHCGTMNGFILLLGDRAKLDELRRTDAFEKFSMRMGRAFDGYGVVPGVTQDGIKKVMDRNPEMFK